MLKHILVLCLLLVFAASEDEYGADCVTDFDCIDEDNDRYYCVTVEPARQTVPAVAADTYYPPNDAVSESAGTAPTENDIDGEAPQCGRSAMPGSPATTFSARQPAVRKCAQCVVDHHCKPGHWCVGLARPTSPGAGNPVPADGTKSYLMRPGSGAEYGADNLAVLETDPSNGYLVATTGSATLPMTFTHEKYGDDEHKVGFCVKKGWPLGEDCLDTVTAFNVDNVDIGTNLDANRYCGLVTEYWEPKCREVGFFGDPPNKPQAPAKIIQWQGVCLDRKCRECTAGSQYGEYVCEPSGFSGLGGSYTKDKSSQNLATSNINRNAEAQILVVQLVFSILIFFLLIVLVVKA